MPTWAEQHTFEENDQAQPLTATQESARKSLHKERALEEGKQQCLIGLAGMANM